MPILIAKAIFDAAYVAAFSSCDIRADNEFLLLPVADAAAGSQRPAPSRGKRRRADSRCAMRLSLLIALIIFAASHYEPYAFSQPLEATFTSRRLASTDVSSPFSLRDFYRRLSLMPPPYFVISSQTEAASRI